MTTTPSPRRRPLARRLARGALYTLATLLALVAVLAVFLRVRHGGGEPYRDVTGAPTFPDSALEVVLESAEPVGNVAVAPDGRVFYTIHPESRPTGAKLLEWTDAGPRPFPSAGAQDRLFDTVLGVVVDRQGRLWTIDHGEHGTGDARLLAFDLATGAVVHDHVFSSDVAPLGSFLQDLQVDARGHTVYIADVSFFRKSPAIVVYDVATQTARRVLDSHPSVVPQDWLIRNPIKDMDFFGGIVTLKAGVDGIALTRDDEWLYYGAMNHDTLYRVRTADLRERALPAPELASRVQAVGEKPLCDGLSSDLAGNVLVTDVEHGAVLRISPTGQSETLIATDRIRWPDALSYGPDGWLYVADSAIPDQMLRSRGHMAESAPYRIYRFQPGIAGVPGQ